MNSINALASKFIENLYIEEAMRDNPTDEIPNTKRKMSLTAPIETVLMFDAIAARFGKTRTQLIEPALELYAEQLFLSLNDSDRESLAASVDSLCTENLPEGLEIKSINAAGTFENEVGHWRGFNALNTTF
jgi:hypothetical protein|tara:strand:- start:472 stop:864 length:393 start_codon:yes stop_codon:yes gene_type:complete